jgi:FtsP/CotA-like multicopper oxidase with cupredoxin domain
MIGKFVSLLAVVLVLSASIRTYAQKTVRYDLYVRDTIVQYTGKAKHAIAINGSIPAPALYFTEGDTAELYVHNMMNGASFPNTFHFLPTMIAIWVTMRGLQLPINMIRC